MAVITAPAGTSVPVTLSPTTNPAALLTTKLFVLTAPPLDTLTLVGAVVA
jgi:hypothetical protein